MFRQALLKGKRILVTGGGTGLGKEIAGALPRARRRAVDRRTARRGARKRSPGARFPTWGKSRNARRRHPRRGGGRRDGAAHLGRERAAHGAGQQRGGQLHQPDQGPQPQRLQRDRQHRLPRHVLRHPRGGQALDRGRAQGLGASRILVTWVHTGSPYVVPSAMSKAGLHVMTKSLAVEWGRFGIRLNAIAPGPFPTEGATKRLRPDGGFDESAELNPMRRVGRMEELQNLATFLMADGCEWLTGETIAVDGGGLPRHRLRRLLHRARQALRRRLGEDAGDDQGAERQGPRRPHGVTAAPTPPLAATPMLPRPAATLMLLRTGARGLEVLMLQRTQNAAFLGGAYVFPGGSLDASDADAAPRARPHRGAGEPAAGTLERRAGLLCRRGTRVLRGGRRAARLRRERKPGASGARAAAHGGACESVPRAARAREPVHSRRRARLLRPLDHAPGRTPALRRALLRRPRARGARKARTTPPRRSTTSGSSRDEALERGERGEIELVHATRQTLADFARFAEPRSAFEYAHEPGRDSDQPRLLGPGTRGRAVSSAAATRRTSRSTGAIRRRAGRRATTWSPASPNGSTAMSRG